MKGKIVTFRLVLSPPFPVGSMDFALNKGRILIWGDLFLSWTLCAKAIARNPSDKSHLSITNASEFKVLASIAITWR